ncbi:MAG: BadF/BadG/BcrA/BcrD ATPase family protein [Cyanobacteriota bacterium]|nr:BadF/BadG/BcrA/BcrD ATPase family protein [Cyanobacteriota bacterium]
MAEPPQPAMEPLIAGFDAGQTHTTCRLARSADGHVVGQGEGPGVCHLAAPGAEAMFRAALVDSLTAALVACGQGAGAVKAVAIGASGIEQGSDVQIRGNALASGALGVPAERVLVCGDERTALRGAFGAAPGIVVISGTGSIAVGRNNQGREHRCGGWGWLLDGAGSAMDIGRDGLALSLRMADGRHPPSPLLAALWQALGVEPQQPGAAQAIKAMVVADGFGAAGFAALAPLVAEAAAAGDADGQRILQASGQALAAMAAAVARGLQLAGPVPVCAVGGAIRHLPGLAAALEVSLADVLPQARLVHPLADACHGALGMAADLAANLDLA